MSDDPNRPPLTAPSRPAPTIPGEPVELAAHDGRGGSNAPPPAQARVLKKWPFILGGSVILLLAIVAVAWGPVVRSLTISKARDNGVIFDEVGEIDVGWFEVTVYDYTFSLEGVEGVLGQGKELSVDLDFLDPLAMRARELEIELVGSAAVLAVDISEWTGRHPELIRIPTKAVDVNVSWQESASGPAWLKLRGGTVEPLKNGAKLTAERTSVFGLPIGGVGAVWRGNEATAKLGFGRSDEGDAPILIEVENLKTKPKAKIELRPTPLVKLSGPLGVLLPITGVTVSGNAELAYRGKRNAPIAGHIDAKLVGYRPPLPREARGFDFGDTTKFFTNVEVSADRKKVSFSKTKVKYGGFVLNGDGSIERGDSYAAVNLDLAGKISCAALAKAAIAAGLGSRIGPMAERLASGAVDGAVTVTIGIRADTRNLLATRIDRQLGVGCGIKWPKLPDIPEGLPRIPGLPQLPGFPGMKE